MFPKLNLLAAVAKAEAKWLLRQKHRHQRVTNQRKQGNNISDMFSQK
jgi:hypothetical protein